MHNEEIIRLERVFCAAKAFAHVNKEHGLFTGMSVMVQKELEDAVAAVNELRKEDMFDMNAYLDELRKK